MPGFDWGPGRTIAVLGGSGLCSDISVTVFCYFCECALDMCDCVLNLFDVATGLYGFWVRLIAIIYQVRILGLEVVGQSLMLWLFCNFYPFWIYLN